MNMPRTYSTAGEPETAWATDTLINPEPWTRNALCAQVDPELFFPPRNGAASSARQVCAACPVATMCLEYALRTGQTHGVWGGLSPRQLGKLRRDAA